MYIPKHFAEDDPAILRDFIRQNSFGILTSAVDGTPFATHLPFLLEGDTLVAHMARANPHWRAFAGGGEVLCVFSGPHAYVSPRWYAAENAVPTWNYAAVHVYGTPEIVVDAEAAHADQKKLADEFEAGADAPWSLDDRDPDYIAGMIRAIVNFRIPIARIEGKFKLSQNRDAVDRASVIEALSQSPHPDERNTAEMMRNRE
jgi:transcriptional regulator